MSESPLKKSRRVFGSLSLIGSLALSITLPGLNALAASSNSPTLVRSIEGVKEYKLDNGLQILLYKDSSKPKILVDLIYKVGSRHEGYGEFGMAHLLEHMLFKGTPSRPDIMKILQDKGAEANATTSSDRTNYYESLAASPENLEFALSLEADRMINSKIAAEDLAKEFSVVRNEFENNENNPSGKLMEKMLHAAYQWHGYGRTTIGNKSDIEKVSADSLRKFYKHYYQPDNAVLIVTGAFDEADGLARIQKNFGSIPRPLRALAETYTREPIQEGANEVILERRGDESSVYILYHTVSGADPVDNDLSALAYILFDRPSGLFYKEFVKKGLFTSITGGNATLAEPGYFFVGGNIPKGQDPRKIAQKLIAAMETIKLDQITQRALDLYKADVKIGEERTFADAEAVGFMLGESVSIGDWRLAFESRERTDKLTLNGIKKATQWFKPSNRTLGIYLPSAKPVRTPEPNDIDVAKMLKDYKGRTQIEDGEAFDTSYDNLKKRTEIAVMDQGIKFALLPKKKKGKLVTIDIQILLQGPADEMSRQRQAIALLPNLMVKGTKIFDSERLNEELILSKSSIYGEGQWSPSDPGVVKFSMSTKREKLPEAFELLRQILREPRFDEKEFDLLHKHSIQGFEEAKFDPGTLSAYAFGLSVMPYPKGDVHATFTMDEDLASITRLKLADIKNVYNNWIGAEKVFVTVVGDFEAAGMKTQIQRLFAGWKSKVHAKKLTFPYAPSLVSMTRIDTPDKKGAQVMTGYSLLANSRDPEFPAIRLANQVWGGGSASRVWKRIRDKDGLTYGVYGGISVTNSLEQAVYSTNATCAPENADKVAKAMDEELRLFAGKGITQTELDDAKKAYFADRRISFADDGYLKELLMNDILWNRDWSFNEALDNKVKEVTLDQINAVIKKFFTPDRVFTVIAADEKVAKEKIGDAPAGAKSPTVE